MMYLLLNRENVVVDILEHPRYLKLQSSTGIVIACEEHEGTGVIGSDDNTHYTLVKADSKNSPDAVVVMAVEEIPSGVIAGKVRLNTETGEFEPRYTLEEVQIMKQEENKSAFAAYLASHPMTWVDGKQYGITQEDQSEISLNLAQYQIAVQAGVDTPILEWHATHEECQPWAAEQLTALSLAISAEVYPHYHQMQEYKTRIFGATSVEEVEAIECVFETMQETEVSDE